MTNPYKLNSLMRQIIDNDFNGNQSAFARAINTTKQEVYKFYHNRTKLSFERLRKFADKCGYNISFQLEKK